MSFDPSNLPKAPPGFQWVYNRLPRTYEAMFDFKSYSFEPHETRLMQDDTALFLTANSIVKVDLSTSTGVRALVAQDSQVFGQPYDEDPGDEAIDRSSGDNPMGWGTREGIKTHAARLPVGTKPKRAAEAA